MTDAELEAERIALLAEQRALEYAYERLRCALTADDSAAHAALLTRLIAHIARVRAQKTRDSNAQTRSVPSERNPISN